MFELKLPLLSAYFALICALGCSSSPSGRGGEGGGGAAGAGGDGGTGTGGATSSCGPVLTQPKCTTSGWCWELPTPIGSNLEAITASENGTSAIAVGSAGAIVRNCGAGFVVNDSDTDVNLHAVWHPDAKTAWVVGDLGTVLTLEDSGWSKHAISTTATLRAVWGTSPSDVWIGGDADETGTVLFHWNGVDFTRQSVAANATAAIRDIDGTSPSNVFAVGGTWDSDLSLRWNGTSWEALAAVLNPHDFGPLAALAVTAGGEVFAFLDGYNTSQMVVFGQGGFQASTDSSLLKFSALHLDGQGRPMVVLPSEDPAFPGRGWAFDGTGWSDTEDRFSSLPAAVWSASGNAPAWAVGQGSAVLARGATGEWTNVPEISAFDGNPYKLEGNSESNLWLTTDDAVYHRTESGWSLALEPGFVSAIAIDASGRPYLSLADGVIRYQEGQSWLDIPAPPFDFASSIAAASPSDVWSVSSSGEPHHFDGTTWSEPTGYCPTLGVPAEEWWPSGMTFRTAPDGTVWLIAGQNGLFQVSSPCARLVAQEGPDTLFVDMAWSPTGEQWALTYEGALYRRQGNVLVKQKELTVTAKRLHIGANTIHVAFGEDITGVASVNSTTFEVAPPSVGPAIGVPWLGENSAVLGVLGGILRLPLGS